MLRPLLAGCLIAGALLAAAPAEAAFFGPAQECFDMPRVIDLVATADQRQLYGVGALGTSGHPAIALWQNDLDTGRLAIERVWRADELEPQPVSVYFAVALSPDQRFLY